MLEKKHLVFLAGATAPFAPPLGTALIKTVIHAIVSQILGADTDIGLIF